MKPSSVSAQSRMLQMVFLGTFLLMASLVGTWVVQKHLWAESELEALAPRHARLLGLMSSADPMKNALVSTKATLLLKAYPADQDSAQAGNAAQQKIRTLFADSKLDVISIQVLPVTELKFFDRIGIVVRVEGELIGLHNAMTALDAQNPVVWFDSLNMQTVGLVKPKSAQRLSAQFSLFVLRSRT